MAERSIILHAHEVRGVLAGTQTQIRRIIKPQPCTLGDVVPYRHKAGDRLWVRETWQEVDGQAVYSATPKTNYLSWNGWRWRPSIHMPRWASRIDLEVTGVRVERLQDISEADAIAEGAEPVLVPPDGGSGPYCEGFRGLWESIHGPGSWDRNDLVRVISFKRGKP